MSDAHHDEIAKLEALYAQNPEGRLFTHLAEACRKVGDLDRAREVLTEGIQRHPDYSSAHVVLGRVLMDLDQYDEARAEFRRVLELDGHNLVALRSLGDIARIEGRDEDALDHYRQLLEMEPSDSDVRSVVQEMTDGLVIPGSEDETEGAPELEVAEPEVAEPEVVEPEGVEPEGVEADPWSPEPEAEEWADEAGEPETDAWTGDAEPEAGEPEVAEPEVVEPEVAEPEGVEADPWSPEPEAEEWADEAGEAETDAWTADAELEAAEPETAELEAAEPEAAEPEGMDREQEGEGEGADVMTETIAQVYARQGLYDRAAEVYRELVRTRPDDEALRERLTEMEEKAAEADEAYEAYEAYEVSGIEVEDTGELTPDETGPVDGFQTVEFEAEAEDVEEVAPLAGFEPDEPDEPDEPEARPEGGEETEVWDVTDPGDWAADAEDEGVEVPAVEAVPEVEELGMEDELETEEDEPASPWTGEEWNPEVEAETPYAWADAGEAEEDASPPIRDYMQGLLGWDGEQETTSPPAPSLAAEGDEEDGPGRPDDEDLEVFRSWLESLKQ